MYKRQPRYDLKVNGDESSTGDMYYLYRARINLKADIDDGWFFNSKIGTNGTAGMAKMGTVYGDDIAYSYKPTVSFMELYSLTTGLIGQSGRRGALMLTIDVKHPDVKHFIKVKKMPNWVTKQIVEQCSWSGKFNDNELETIKKQVMENTQVRFANISIKKDY